MRTAYQRARARVDAWNDQYPHAAHPAHVGDDGFEPEEWREFETAAASASRAASENTEYEQLTDALWTLIQGKGSTGVAAVFVLGEPIRDAFDECYRHGLLARP